MKLLVITSLKDYQKEAIKLFHKAGIKVFSVSKTMGFKEDDSVNLMDSWFSNEAEYFDSIVMFSFTTEEKSNKAMELVDSYNTESKIEFPIRVFIMSIEKASYPIS
ncbi:MAG: hypothetical protein HOP37_04650 [Cyclobacteriaceae bacterium]|nr:hypothetical protein [Cyclobacteriaceae bacterium]